jgi:hypothetical protein
VVVMQGSRSGVHPTYSGLTPWGGQTCTRVRDVKGVSNSTLDGSFWLHTVGTLGGWGGLLRMRIGLAFRAVGIVSRLVNELNLTRLTLLIRVSH